VDKGGWKEGKCAGASLPDTADKIPDIDVNNKKMYDSILLGYIAC